MWSCMTPNDMKRSLFDTASDVKSIIYGNKKKIIIWARSCCINCRVTVAQNLAFVGLSYSSPIVAIGMGCLIPSISFIIAVVCRFASIHPSVIRLYNNVT